MLFVCLSVLARVEEDAEQNLQDQAMEAYDAYWAEVEYLHPQPPSDLDWWTSPDDGELYLFVGPAVDDVDSVVDSRSTSSLKRQVSSSPSSTQENKRRRLGALGSESNPIDLTDF